jgi:hypothetical protein
MATGARFVIGFEPVARPNYPTAPPFVPPVEVEMLPYVPKYVMGGGDVQGLGFRFETAADGTTFAVGRDGYLEAFTPPYYADMHEAFTGAIPRPHPDTVECVKAYCQYVWDTYGRFPLTIDPMYQRLTTQAQHIDCGFYDEYYPPGAYSQQHADHMRLWHPEHA